MTTPGISYEGLGKLEPFFLSIFEGKLSIGLKTEVNLDAGLYSKIIMQKYLIIKSIVDA